MPASLLRTVPDRRRRACADSFRGWRLMMRIFLACTPRTGNLWIRRIISQVLNLQRDVTKPEDNSVSIELYYVEQPTPFVGFNEQSQVRIAFNPSPGE